MLFHPPLSALKGLSWNKVLGCIASLKAPPTIFLLLSFLSACKTHSEDKQLGHCYSLFEVEVPSSFQGINLHIAKHYSAKVQRNPILLPHLSIYMPYLWLLMEPICLVRHSFSIFPDRNTHVAVPGSLLRRVSYEVLGRGRVGWLITGLRWKYLIGGCNSNIVLSVAIEE